MVKGKRFTSLVLALALFAGLFGCAEQIQSSEVESAVSDERSAVSSMTSSVFSDVISNEPLSEISESVSETNISEDDGFEDSRIINTVFTRKALATNPLTSEENGIDASEKWVTLFIEENYKQFVPYDINPSFCSGETFNLNTVSGEEERFSTTYCNMRFKTELKPEGLNLNLR